MSRYTAADYREAVRAQLRATAFHLDDPQVTMVDIGLRIHESTGDITDELAVRVHVRRKLRGAVFDTFAKRAPARVVDASRIGFPVDVIEGKYYLHLLNGLPSRAQVFNPLRGGASISNEWFYNFGTLGGLVRDRQTGEDMILSNWHILAGADYAQPGLRIYQPGAGDGGWSRYTIARLSRHAMQQGIDAAVATLTGIRPLVNDEIDLGPVTGVSSPVLGQPVVKSGRTSGITYGLVTGVEGIQTIPYRGFTQVVRHIVHIAQGPGGGQVSAPGDSGSWWLDDSTHQAVGLHFAGSNDPEYGLAIAMPEVLAALDVEIPAPDANAVGEAGKLQELLAALG